MSGSASSDRVAVRPEATAGSRRLLLTVLLVCAAPVVASYLAYFVLRPDGRTNYSELITPPRPLPEQLALSDLNGNKVVPQSLHGQWLVVVVSGGACDAGCERQLWLQRQLHQTLGAERDRVDKLWILDDTAAPRSDTLRAVGASNDAGTKKSGAAAAVTPPTLLRVSREALSAWLAPAPGHRLEDHIYIVDPRGDWMMRAPADPEPARLKRDLEKLLRASAGWDRPGR
ncbi:MAG: hypothetical protein M3Z29_05835 [Pseudomonadota bacterium]|nr:hypothetical protein [Pseudomonadota bacterium]